MISRVILLFLCFLVSGMLLANTGEPGTNQNFKVRYIGIEMGLSNNAVTSIYQDKRGFMWVGTYDGLNRYDGYNFLVFHNQPNDSSTLINNRIVSIYENDQSKWIRAAEAAYEVIALNRYSLVDNYRNLFQSVTNNEIIFGRNYAASNGLERNNYPIGFTGAVGGINPSQNLVDAYETLNGLSIAEDPEYDQQNPYLNRDPRLQMSIITNDSQYKGRKVESYQGGMDGYGKARATKTGYYLKKFMDEGLDLLQNRSSVHTWIYFRYAEVLLNYAEAMNEAYGPDAIAAGLPISAKEAINTVRQRSGVAMPEVSVASAGEFRAKIKNERRVELSFEEHRFWDLRRWKDAEEVLSQPINIAVIGKNSDGTFTYSYQEAEERVFLEKMYLYPIPADEINKAGGSLQQNPNW